MIVQQIHPKALSESSVTESMSVNVHSARIAYLQPRDVCQSLNGNRASLRVAETHISALHKRALLAASQASSSRSGSELWGLVALHHSSRISVITSRIYTLAFGWLSFVFIHFRQTMLLVRSRALQRATGVIISFMLSAIAAITSYYFSWRSMYVGILFQIINQMCISVSCDSELEDAFHMSTKQPLNVYHLECTVLRYSIMDTYHSVSDHESVEVLRSCFGCTLISVRPTHSLPQRISNSRVVDERYKLQIRGPMFLLQ